MRADSDQLYSDQLYDLGTMYLALRWTKEWYLGNSNESPYFMPSLLTSSIATTPLLLSYFVDQTSFVLPQRLVLVSSHSCLFMFQLFAIHCLNQQFGGLAPGSSRAVRSMKYSSLFLTCDPRHAGVYKYIFVDLLSFIGTV
jgi:hypothetical protein